MTVVIARNRMESRQIGGDVDGAGSDGAIRIICNRDLF